MVTPKTTAPPPGEGISRERFLEEVARPADGALLRHPKDGWIRADPYPMGGYARRILRGVIAALIPPPPAPHPPDVIERVERHVLDTLPYMPPFNAFGLVLLFHVVDLSPLWRFEALSRLHRLPKADASIILKKMTNSRFMALRQLMLAIKGVTLPGYFDQDEVHEALNYAPAPFMTERVAFRQRLIKGETPNPEDMLGPHSSEIDP